MSSADTPPAKKPCPESAGETPPTKKLCTESASVIKAAEVTTPAESAPTGTESNQAKSEVKAVDIESVEKVKSVESEPSAGHTQLCDKKSVGAESGTAAKVSENTQAANLVGKQGENKAETLFPMSGLQKEMKKSAQDRSASGKQNGFSNEPSQKALSEIDHVDLSKVIEGIQECDLEIEEMTISANQRVMEIEKSLRESKKPVYSKRSALIQHIPEFWLTTLINHHHISHFINEADEDCLQYLKKLHVEEFDDSVSGFKISFLFEPNPYFENEVICKEISYGPSGVLRSKASPIRWRPGHDLTRVTEASASSSKSQPQSFFHWFIQNANPVQDKIAVFIRDDIWPNPLKYFQVHTEDSTIDVSSDGIMIDSSGEEDEDESVLVLEEEQDEDFYLDDEEDNEDIELLENEEEILDEDFDDDSEDDLLLDEEDEGDEEFEEELQLIEARGMAKQGTVARKPHISGERIEAGKAPQGMGKASDKQTDAKNPKQPVPSQAVTTQKSETMALDKMDTEKSGAEQTAVSDTDKDKSDTPTGGDS